MSSNIRDDLLAGASTRKGEGVEQPTLSHSPADPLGLEQVWIAEQGCYNDRYIVGVWRSAEAAMADLPITEAMVTNAKRDGRTPGWRKDRDDGDTWHNGCDWDDAVTLWPHDLR